MLQHMQNKPSLYKTVNRDWRFRYFPEEEEQAEAIKPDYDDSSWQPLAVPHTWSTYETTGELHPFIYSPSEKDDTFWWYGWGWYRKLFRPEEQSRGRKVFIELDGVMKYCKLWLNGTYIGEHKGGYASFSFDLTDAVKFGEDNIIAIAVSNRRNDTFGGIAPMTAGNFNVYGGIYRDVRIVLKNKLHIPFQGNADHEGGTFVTTPEVSEDRATVRVKTYVKNDDAEAKQVIVFSRIVSPNGQEVAHIRSDPKPVQPGQLYEFDQLSAPVVNPLLWSPEHPHLYRVHTEVFCDGDLMDAMESPLGFRYFDWNYEEKRLYLNGHQVLIHGTNRHQEYPWLGDAIPKWMHDMDLHDIKYNQGHNFLRTCHYTSDKAIYEWCDRHGVIVCEEVPNIKNISFGPDIQQQQVREMIRRDRNHPSIIMWSMGNETDHSADGAWAMAEDSTRIIHYRHVRGDFPDMHHTHEQMDMENLLRCTIRGWYNADVKDEEPANGQHVGNEEWQHDNALIPGASQRGHIDDGNGVMWIYADHGADREYLNSPLKHVNPKGWVDSYRIPKLMYYLWQAHWLETPMVYIHPYDWTERYIGQQRTIKINSNCDLVELKVNGASVGVQYPAKENGFTVLFRDVSIGRGSLTAEGRRGEASVTHELAMAGKPAAITLSSSHSQLLADRAGITLVKVDIVDENGVHVYGATNDLHVTLNGPGKLVGPSLYTTDTDKCEEMGGTMYIDAPLIVPVRSNAEAGIITLTVSSPGLASAAITIVTVPVSEDEREKTIFEPLLADTPGTYAFDSSEWVNRPKTNAAQIAPYQIAEINHDVDLSDVPDAHLEVTFERYIKDNNPGIQMYFEAFPYLLEHFMNDFRRERVMVADDYNFNIQHYNRYCREVHKIRNSSLSKEEKLKQRNELAMLLVHDRNELSGVE